MTNSLKGLRNNADILKNVATKEAQKAYKNAEGAIKTVIDAISGMGI